MQVSADMQARVEAALEADDGLALARKVVAGRFTATALLEGCLARIDAGDARIGAVCHLAPDVGLDSARVLDAEVAALGRVLAPALDALPDGHRRLLARRPFAGVPLLLKDLGTAARDLPSRMGSRLFGELTGGPVDWPVDSTLVTRLRQAGFVPFGRTATPELGISATTETRAYGRPTRNPWRLDRSAGGSSGGAGAAVAAGFVPLAHATDGAGSIRIPASCCGLVGLKPSRALMPTGPLQGEAWGGFATEHALTQTIRDSAAMLAVTAGSDLGAPYPAPALDRVLLARLAAGGPVEDADPVSSRPLRIGVADRRFDGGPIDPRIAAAVRTVADVLAAAGHRIEPARLSVSTEAIVETVIRTMAASTAAAIDAFCHGHGLDPAALPDDALEPATRGAWRLGRAMSAGDYIGLGDRGNRLVRTIAAEWIGFDVVLSPTLAEPPAPIGRFRMDNDESVDYLDYRLGPNGLIHYSPFTPLANLTGQPAVSLPLAMIDGLPVGCQLIGAIGEDARLLALGAWLERAMPWSGRRAGRPIA